METVHDMKAILGEDFFKEEVRCDYLVSAKMKRIWAVELDMYLSFAEICEKYGLNHFLIAGSLLGAVRHNGFIPWDDDMDIALLEKDYSRLIKVLREYKSNIYILQEHRIEPDYISTFPKFRVKEGNLLGSNPERGKLYKYKGVAIDIFKISRISYLNARISGSIHNRLLSWTYKITNIRIRHLLTNILWYISKTLMCMCNLFNITRKPNEMHHGQAQGVIKKINYEHLLPYKRIPYDGELLPVPNKTESFLRLYFGEDYMKLPDSIHIHNESLIASK